MVCPNCGGLRRVSTTAAQMPGSRSPKVDQSLIEVANSPTAILKKVEEIGLDKGNEWRRSACISHSADQTAAHHAAGTFDGAAAVAGHSFAPVHFRLCERLVGHKARVGEQAPNPVRNC